jgi:hypothetical protein
MDSKEIQHMCCEILEKLNSNNAERPDMFEAIAALVRSMERHSDDAEVVLRTTGILCILSCKDSYRAAIAKYEGARVIVLAISKHVECEDLQQSACSTFTQFTVSDPAAMAELGAVQVFVCAMSRYRANAMIQELGCEAFDKLHETPQSIITLN